MKAKSLFEYFFFGTSVRYLQDVDSDTRIHDSSEGLYVLGNIQNFFEQLNELGLYVTLRASSRLRSFSDELESEEEDAVLSAEQARKIRRFMNDLRTTLEAELEGFQVYTVTPKRIDVSK